MNDAIYVCEDCHKIDMDAIECEFTYDVHECIMGTEVTTCHICGKTSFCVPCEAYNETKILNESILKARYNFEPGE